MIYMITMLPAIVQVNTEYMSETIVSDTVREYAFPRYGQYVYDIYMECHPLVIDDNGKKRLSVNDVEKIDLLIDNRTFASLSNHSKNEPASEIIHGVYGRKLDFFCPGIELPIVTAAINVNISLRVTYWRAPLTPIWFKCTVGLTDPSESNHLNNATLEFPSAGLIYRNGVLWQGEPTIYPPPYTLPCLPMFT